LTNTGQRRPNTGHVLQGLFLKGGPVIVRYCDYCGVVIGNGADVVQLQESDARGYRWCLVGEYHDYCWRTVSDGIVLVHEFGGSLERIPVATSQAIAARKRKHRPAE
jgi:hypothetical protein